MIFECFVNTKLVHLGTFEAQIFEHFLVAIILRLIITCIEQLLNTQNVFNQAYVNQTIKSMFFLK